jgi:hypothetical protein
MLPKPLNKNVILYTSILLATINLTTYSMEKEQTAESAVECMEAKENLKEQTSKPRIEQNLSVKRTIKAIYLGTFCAFIAYKWTIPSIASMYFRNNIDYYHSLLKEKPLLFSLNTLASSDLAKDRVKIIQDIAKSMNIPSNTLIEITRSLAGVGMFYDAVLKLNPEMVSKVSLEQLRFAIGHEFGHELYSHSLKRDIAEITVPVLTIFTLKLSDHLTTKLIKKLKTLTQIKETDLSYKALNILETLNHLFYNFPLTHYILTSYILSKISQYHEKQADLIAVRTLNCAQDALEFFSNNKTISIQDVLLRYPLAVTKYMIDQLVSGNFKSLIECISLLLTFNTHPPIEQRIAYIEQFNNHKT